MLQQSLHKPVTYLDLGSGRPLSSITRKAFRPVSAPSPQTRRLTSVLGRRAHLSSAGNAENYLPKTRVISADSSTVLGRRTAELRQRASAKPISKGTGSTKCHQIQGVPPESRSKRATSATPNKRRTTRPGAKTDQDSFLELK